MFLAFQAANPDISFSLIAPEVIVSVAGVIVMMVDAFSRRGQRWLTGGLSIIALIAAGISSLWLWAAAPLQRAQSALHIVRRESVEERGDAGRHQRRDPARTEECIRLIVGPPRRRAGASFYDAPSRRAKPTDLLRWTCRRQWTRPLAYSNIV